MLRNAVNCNVQKKICVGKTKYIFNFNFAANAVLHN